MSPEHNSINCIIGWEDHLLDHLHESFRKAHSIDIIVAFLRESGAALIVNDLVEAKKRGASIRILTGRYLNITEPSALYLLKDRLGSGVSLRFFSEEDISFHPKAYICCHDEDGELYIGSSNISKSALTSGLEWNYRLTKKENARDFEFFQGVFEELYNKRSIIIDDKELKEYSTNWRRPKVYDDLSRMDRVNDKVISFPQPKGAQIEALYELKKSRQEGFEKGLVVGATGIGKTYLAAFDSRGYKRVLFIAHREEILIQAEAAFKSVRKDDSSGFFTGRSKDKDADMVFATVQTLGREEYLNDEYFKKDAFDYIVVDEFHHAAAGSYSSILNYFTPKFLLGLTATPERMDNKDVFALCDYNTVYEVRLKEAINKGYLVPFRYYGIYDGTVDYETIEYKNGRYNEDELEEALMINKRAQSIINHYGKYESRRALGFCASRKHAEYMAKCFNDNGIKSCSVVSGDSEDSADRHQAIKELNKGNISVIFSVDMFNEGLDVPSVDMVMFLRPTESPTIFLQQLGRGLRKAQGKKYLNVLDFIGNYRKASLIPYFLTGKPSGKASGTRVIPKEEEYPDGCIVDFDFKLIDIFKKQAQQNRDIKEQIHEEYLRIKALLGRRPSRLDMFTYMDEEVYENMKRRRELNIFSDYLSYIYSIGEEKPEERELLDTAGHDFIRFVETTSMSKSYKMPVLLAFYNGGRLKEMLSEDDIYNSFKSFYSIASNGVDLSRHKATSGYKAWGKKQYCKLSKDNPQRFLAKTNPEFFMQFKDSFGISNQVAAFAGNQCFMEHFKDAIDYRTRRYYKERLEDKE